MWAKDEVTLSAAEANQVLDLLEAAREFCAGKADTLEESDDETLQALFEAFRDAGEEFND